MAPRSLVSQTGLMEKPCNEMRVVGKRKENSALNCFAFAITTFLLKLLMVTEKEIHT